MFQRADRARWARGAHDVGVPSRTLADHLAAVWARFDQSGLILGVTPGVFLRVTPWVGYSETANLTYFIERTRQDQPGLKAWTSRGWIIVYVTGTTGGMVPRSDLARTALFDTKDRLFQSGQTGHVVHMYGARQAKSEQSNHTFIKRNLSISYFHTSAQHGSRTWTPKL